MFVCRQPVSISTWIVGRMRRNCKMAGTSVPSVEPVAALEQQGGCVSTVVAQVSCAFGIGLEWCRVTSP